MSMSDRRGVDVGIEGAGGGGMVFDDEAMASHAAFSSSSLLPSQCFNSPSVTMRGYPNAQFNFSFQLF